MTVSVGTDSSQLLIHAVTGHPKPLRVYVRVGPEFQVPSHAHPGLKMRGWA